MKKIVVVILAACACAVACRADSLSVKMLPGEKWWGLCNSFGRAMPFTGESDFKCDLRIENYGHQSLSFLCSDKGRAIWCAEPVGVTIVGGEISLVSDKGEIVLKEDAGRNLAEAYRYGSKTWFPPTGEEPELLYFSAPQYNTWIELTYHQNEKDILAYAKAMLDHGLPPGIFMIDDTWQLGYGEWYFDMRRFSDPKGMMDKLHAMGYKVLLWMCPFVSMDTPAYRRIAWGRNPDDVKGYPTRGGFLCSSVKKGYGGVPPAAPVNWWNGTSALLDFTHPNAVAWFDEQLERLVRDYGADGFKFDGGGVHFYAGCVGLEGSSPKTFAHDPSASPAAQSALYGKFALKYKGSEYRNAFGYAGKPVIMRLHDKAHKWDALRRLVPDMLAAGFVGCPFICPDMIGGGEWTAFLPGAPFEPERAGPCALPDDADIGLAMARPPAGAPGGLQGDRRAPPALRTALRRTREGVREDRRTNDAQSRILLPRHGIRRNPRRVHDGERPSRRPCDGEGRGVAQGRPAAWEMACGRRQDLHRSGDSGSSVASREAAVLSAESYSSSFRIGAFCALCLLARHTDDTGA